MTITIDFNKPATTDNYLTAFVPGLQANLQSLGALLDPTYVTTVSNAQAGTKRWNSTNHYLEQWSGTAWVQVNAAWALKTGDVFSGAMTFNNNIPLQWVDSGATARRIALVSGGNNIYYGDVDNSMSGSSLLLFANATGAIQLNVGTTTIGTVNTAGITVTGGTAGFVSTGKSEFLRGANDGGFVSGWNTANTTRTGYLQFNTAANVTLATDSAIPLIFNTNGANGLVISSIQNVGVGTAPTSGWTSSGNLEVGGGNIVARAALTLGTNAYVGGGVWKYIANGYSCRYDHASGQYHAWYTAPSGLAGASISYTLAMALDNGGNLLVGAATALSSSAGRGLIEINGSGNSLLALNVGGARKGYLWHDGTNLAVNADAGGLNLNIGGVVCVGVSTSGNTTFSYSAATTPKALGNSGTAFTINLLTSNVFTLTMTGNVPGSGWTLQNPQDGQTVNIFITQDATGSRTLAYPSSVKWPGGVAGVLSTTANAVDLLVLTYRASTGFYYATLAKAFA